MNYLAILAMMPFTVGLLVVFMIFLTSLIEEQVIFAFVWVASVTAAAFFVWGLFNL